MKEDIERDATEIARKVLDYVRKTGTENMDDGGVLVSGIPDSFRNSSVWNEKNEYYKFGNTISGLFNALVMQTWGNPLVLVEDDVVWQGGKKGRMAVDWNTRKYVCVLVIENGVYVYSSPVVATRNTKPSEDFPF